MREVSQNDERSWSLLRDRTSKQWLLDTQGGAWVPASKKLFMELDHRA
jgi:hypothetical protein